MIKFISILLCTLLSFPIIACDKPVTAIKQGEIATCSGYLFSPEKEKEVRIKIAEYDLLKEYSNTQTELNQILNKRLENTQQYNDRLYKRLNEEKRSNEIYNALYFGLGVIVTGIIAANVGR